MSCWVVPAVAADYWGVSLEEIWARIYRGQVPHKAERGFVFVDVAPWIADLSGSIAHQPPPTFIAGDQAGDLAAGEAELLGISFDFESAEQTASDSEEPDDLPPLDDEESATFGRLSWEETRRRVSRTRVPPKVCSF